MEMNHFETPEELRKKEGNEGDKNDNEKAKGKEKEEMPGKSNSSKFDGDVNKVGAGNTIGTNGGNDEKKDNTAENARKVRENDRSEGEE